MKILSLLSTLCLTASVRACDDCYGPSDPAKFTRLVPRMQPEAEAAATPPKSPLSWGMLNILHTTDTHGWLEGHIKEQNYGADWGDFKSFAKRMRHQARDLDVDLLLVDTGDLHDGAGLSDATSPDGVESNPIFEHIKYDLLTIGNHELYLSDVAYLTATQFAKYYGDRYISSNVQIFNNATNQYENIANQYRYFTTEKGLRIMAFGVLFDFTGNSNASKVIPAKTMIQQDWFQKAVKFDQPIDLFLLIGHNPVRTSVSTSTIGTVYDAIRSARPDIPIQVLGGHTHIRDFVVYDRGGTGLESGRYCETLGFVSMTGIHSSNYHGAKIPKGVPTPQMPAIRVNGSSASNGTSANTTSTPATNVTGFADLRYFRRYLDWNRLTFAFHANGSQSTTFDTPHGQALSTNITALRSQLNLTALYGCAPQTWCLTCKPFGDPGNIYSVLQLALSATVVNQTRGRTPRLIFLNTGSVRFDLVEGPFTFDDSFIVNPFHDAFQYIANVPYAQARSVLANLNRGPVSKRSLVSEEEEEGDSHDLTARDFAFQAAAGAETCVDSATEAHAHALRRRAAPLTRGLHRRQATTLTPGYTTTDDFGTDGDDTTHSSIPYYPQPGYFQANGSLPTDGSAPPTVDIVFLDFIASNVLAALNGAGASYSKTDVQPYLPLAFDTNAYLPAYAKQAWQQNVPHCPVGKGVGY